MSGRVPGSTDQFPDLEPIVVREEAIELRSVPPELRPFVEHLAEGLLHHGNVAADADLPSQRLLEIGRG